MNATDASMAAARHLQEYYQQCESILASTNRLVNARWQSPIGEWQAGYFRDSHSPDYNHKSPHVINTSTAIVMLCENDSQFRPRDIDAFGGMAFARVCEYYRLAYKDYGWISREGSWSPYTCAWSLRAIAASAPLAGKGVLDAELGARTPLLTIVKGEIDKLTGFIEDWVLFRLKDANHDFDHPYFVYTAFRGLVCLQNCATKVGLAAVSPLFTEFDRIRPLILQRISLEFYRQMTLRLTNVPQHLDIVSLATTLYCLLEYSSPDDELAEDVLSTALDTIVSVQGPTGFWDTGTPLLGSQTGLVGCSSVEIALCLLCNSRSKRYVERHIEHYIKLFQTLRMSFKSSFPELGWPTDIRRKDSGRQTWYATMVLAFISHLAYRLRSMAAAGLLREFQYREGKPKVPMNKLRDYKGFLSLLNHAFLEPRSEALNAKTKEELEKAKKRSRCSAILFGPPGTGKTSIAWALADALSFRFIELGPSDFLKRGIDGLFSQADEVFHRLMLAEKAVVLFDELDEWVLERRANGDKLSRFLTTYMLPWLQRLRDKADMVFLFATNHLENFDEAIKRYGRIDLVIPIGPPLGKDKAAFLQDLFEEHGVPKPNDADALALVAQMQHRTTIGDMGRALSRCLQSGRAYSQAQFLAELTPSKLLISAADWQHFREQSAPYLEPPHTADSDKDELADPATHP